MKHGWIGVDLDGTLAFHGEWLGHTHIGEPIPLMLKRVKLWLSEGTKDHMKLILYSFSNVVG